MVAASPPLPARAARHGERDLARHMPDLEWPPQGPRGAVECFWEVALCCFGSALLWDRRADPTLAGRPPVLDLVVALVADDGM